MNTETSARPAPGPPTEADVRGLFGGYLRAWNDHDGQAAAGASVGRLNAGGLIAENRDYWNMADAFNQLGLLPAA